MAEKNPFGKTVEQASAYATYVRDGWEWLVLKTYQRPDKEDGYSRWFLAVKSPFTFGSHELGDGYAKEVMEHGVLADCTPEWREHYA
jgi:hypothetical protein